jgi:transcriptional regulator with XRE-family HTH domain
MADDQSNPAVSVNPGQRFGRRLCEQRERRGITLDAIAASTKIKGSLFAGLERGDVSDWPAGIFRRAFIREYARGIGLVPEPIVAEFLEIFGSGDAAGEPERTGGELRLTLALEPDRPPAGLTPALVGLIEATCLVLVAIVASWITAVSFGTTCCALLLLYYPIATAYAGCTPAAWFLSRDVAIPERRRTANRSAPADIRERLYLIKSANEPAPPDGPIEVANANSDSPRVRSGTR